MIQRQATPEDYGQIMAIYEKLGLGFDMPGFETFEDIQVLCNDSGKIEMCLAGKKEISYYLLMNPECELSPKWKWEYLKAIISKSFENLKAKGYNTVFCWIPPVMEKSFGRRLLKIGGKKYTWPVFGKEL